MPRVGKRDRELMLDKEREPAICVRAEESKIGGNAQLVRCFERLLAALPPAALLLDEIGDMLLDKMQLWRRRQLSGAPCFGEDGDGLPQPHDARRRDVGARCFRPLLNRAHAEPLCRLERRELLL